MATTIPKNYAYRACRAFPGTHRWVDTGAIPISHTARGGGVGYTYQCDACGCERDSFYDRLGHPTYSRYRYPDGYALPGVHKADVRVAFLRPTTRKQAAA